MEEPPLFPRLSRGPEVGRQGSLLERLGLQFQEPTPGGDRRPSSRPRNQGARCVAGATQAGRPCRGRVSHGGDTPGTEDTEGPWFGSGVHTSAPYPLSHLSLCQSLAEINALLLWICKKSLEWTRVLVRNALRGQVPKELGEAAGGRKRRGAEAATGSENACHTLGIENLCRRSPLSSRAFSARRLLDGV